uniref:N-acetylgalactosaminide beta-1,3-galactosyltransferase n=1 Tax=Rhabditophanes sp. KR3021 TaxID=114890 RepID=A0AC35TNN6_9BILA
MVRNIKFKKNFLKLLYNCILRYCKADDDSYLLLNNLKKFLKKFDHTKAYYIGHPLKFNSLKYNSGGTGYILSREAVKQLSEKLIYNETICPFNIFEDEGIGMCLKNINIEALEFTEDQDQSQLFLRDGFESAFNGNLFNYRRNNIRKKMEGIRAISNDLISVHRLSSFEIYLTDKLLYKMNVK